MNVQSWTGYTDPLFGYGAMFHGFKDALPKTVTLDPQGSVNVHMSVPNFCMGWLAGQHRVSFTMWETTVLDPGFVRWLGQYDQILVPCEQNVELFSQHHQDVRLVPLGVDHKFWRPQPRVVDGPFRFHAGGSLWRRKGLDVVVRAFEALKLPDAVLHIKAAPHASDTPKGGFPPNVVLHREWMSLEEQRDWFNQADCFIAASRGEGFGLMPLQAIALGVPTIVSETTGQVQFADCAWGRVPVSKVRADTIGEWDEPDQGVLEELMMLAYKNRDTIREEAELNIPKTERFAWKHSTKKLLAAVPTGVMLDHADRVTPSVELSVRVRRKVNATIGNDTYKMEPGYSYVIPEHVFEVLSASNALETA